MEILMNDINNEIKKTVLLEEELKLAKEEISKHNEEIRKLKSEKANLDCALQKKENHLMKLEEELGNEKKKVRFLWLKKKKLQNHLILVMRYV